MQMENMLVTNPTSTSALRRRIKNIEKAWTEFEGQYDRLRAIAGQGRLQDQVQAEQECTCHATLQHRYLEVHASAEDALDDDKHRSGTRNCSNPPRKPRRNQMPTSGVAAASSQVTKLPSNLKTSNNVRAMCPACAGTHTAMGSNDKAYYKTRLSSCEVFTGKSANERAMIIAATNGCVL